MNIINNNPSKINWGNKNYNNNTNTEVQNKTQTLKGRTQDSVEISEEGINAFNSKINIDETSKVPNSRVVNPMDKLVSAGIISKKQQNTALNALEVSKKNMVAATGIYTNKYFNPLDKLVATGAINEDQKKAIQDVFANEKQTRISQLSNGRIENPQTQMDKLDKNSHLSPMDNLMASGLMTEEEKKIIQSTFSA